MRILRSGCGEADELEVKRSSRGGEVSAVVDAAGRVRDVSFGSACRGSDEAGLSRVVMEAIEAGRRRAAGEVESVVHRYAGEDTAQDLAQARASRGKTSPHRKKTYAAVRGSQTFRQLRRAVQRMPVLSRMALFF